MSARLYKSIAEVPKRLLDGWTEYSVPPAQIKRKYHNTRKTVDGKHFDSKLEARCDQWLTLRQKAGEVAWFVRQVRFDLEGGVIYRADFLAVLANGGVEVIDATGMMTSKKRNKLKQVKARYGVDVVLWTDKA